MSDQPHTSESLRRWLLENHLAHWLAHALPAGREDYVQTMDRQWRGAPQPPYHLVAATRLLYSFSVGVLAGGGEAYRRAADHMYRFLTRYFPDPANGGWFWSVDLDGPVEAEKRTYGHVFAILALSTYAHAADDERPLALAAETAELLDRKAWEPTDGGYGQGFDAAWNPTGTDKRLNEQMHALEALLALFEMTDAQKHADAVARLCTLTCDRLVRPWGGIYEYMTADWSKAQETVLPGHQLEFGWLLAHAGHRFGNRRWMDVGKQMIDWGWTHGWDEDAGGVYDRVDDAGNVTDDGKCWWPQCEAMVAALTMAELTPSPLWPQRFAACTDWILDHLFDQQYGGIYPDADRAGHVTTDRKAGPFKAGYHVTQAFWMSSVMRG